MYGILTTQEQPQTRKIE